MEFESIDQAVEYINGIQKKYDDLLTAHDGLKSKLSNVTETSKKLNDEISRLKIKNYEYLEQITVSNTGTTQTTKQEPTTTEISLDDIMKDVK